MDIKEAKKIIAQHPGKFYTYVLKRPGGKPFYIGKGKTNGKHFRLEQHIKEALRDTGQNKYKNTIIRKLLSCGMSVDCERMAGTGILCNLTDGGEGAEGIIWNSASRTRASVSHRGKVFSEEHKHKISESNIGKNLGKPGPNKGKSPSVETRKKISIALMGHVYSEERNKKISNSHKGKSLSELTKIKLSIARKGTKYKKRLELTR